MRADNCANIDPNYYFESKAVLGNGHVEIYNLSMIESEPPDF